MKASVMEPPESLVQPRVRTVSDLDSADKDSSSRIASSKLQSNTRYFADYLELTKPRIATMALITVTAGYLLGASEEFLWVPLLVVLLGSGMVAGGGAALNHWWEQRADAAMLRTQRRPLPAGRKHPLEVLAFGVGLCLAGLLTLYFGLPTPGAAIAAGLTAGLYVLIYTPLKQLTTWNTIVGAVPGALPPVIGWLAAQPDLSWQAGSLFAILFVWQLPHFYSIAYMHREDYARGGMKMLPVVEAPEQHGRITGIATCATAALLVPTTALPFLVGAAGWAYLVGGLLLAVWFLFRCIKFLQNRTTSRAKTVLRGSLVYLCGVMILVAIDGILPKYWQ